jgi:Kef-type K+ transport system membrane component KefB
VAFVSLSRLVVILVAARQYGLVLKRVGQPPVTAGWRW